MQHYRCTILQSAIIDCALSFVKSVQYTVFKPFLRKKTIGINYAKQAYMTIGIAHWLDRISPVFDVSDKLCLVQLQGRREVSRKNVVLKRFDPFGRAKEVAALGVNVLLCGAISHGLEKALLATGVQVIGFLCGDLDAVIASFLDGHLGAGAFFMPGFFRQRQRHRFRGLRGKRWE